MRRFFTIFLGVALVSAFGVYSFAGGLKIGHVDTIEVFNEYQRTIDQDEQLEAKKEEVKKTLEEQEEKIRESQGRLEVLREDQREAERQKLQEMMERYSQLRQVELEEITRKRDGMMRDIVEDIDQTIKDYARKNGYDLIINGNSVLYAPKKNDLTAEVLSILNRVYRR